MKNRSPSTSSRQAYAAFQRPAFRRFLGGALAVNLSNQVLKVAAGWHLYTLTHSAWSLAMVGLMSYLPILLFSLPAGWAADHFDRRKVLVLAQLAQMVSAAGLLALALTGAPAWPWYLMLFVGASGRALQTPSSVSLYPLLIEPEEVPRAVSWNSANYQLGAILGPILGGLLVHHAGIGVALAFVLAGPIINLALVPGLKVRRQPPKPAQEPWKQKLLKGFEFVWQDKAIFGALSVDFVAVLFGGVEGIMPMFANDILGCGAQGLGLLMAAPFVGALIMSFALAHLRAMQKPGRAMLGCVAGFGACMLVFSVSHSFLLSFGALVLAGILDQVSVLVRQTLVQMRTPEHLRGRVQAVNFLFIGSSNELGEFESGMTAAWLGPVGSVVLGGIAVLVVVAGWSLAFPALRELPPLDANPS